MGLSDLVARLAWDGSQFEAGTGRIKKEVSSLESAFMSLDHKWSAGSFLKHFAAPAAIIGTVAGLAHSIMESADEVTRLSDQFALSTDQVQLLQQEAARTNTTFEKLAESSETIQKALKAAAEHGEAPIFSREQIGAAEQTGGVFKSIWTAIKQAGAETLRQAHYIVGGGINQDIAFLLGLASQPYAQARPKAEYGQPSPQAVAADEARMKANSEWAARQFEEYDKRAVEARRLLEGVGYNVQSDALTSVGNFLGGDPYNSVAVESINVQVQIIRSILERNQNQPVLNPLPTI